MSKRTSTKLSPLDVIPRRGGRTETKIATLNSVFTSVSTAGSYVALTSNIAAGADVNNRIGRRIRIHRIGFQGTLIGGQTNSVADDPYNSFRIVIIVCTPGLASLGLSVNSFFDPRYQSGVFQVLYDKTVLLRASAKDSTGYIPAAKQVVFNLGTSLPLEYASSGSVAPVGRELRAYAVSDSTAVNHPGFSTDSTFVIEFSDTA